MSIKSLDQSIFKVASDQEDEDESNNEMEIGEQDDVEVPQKQKQKKKRKLVAVTLKMVKDWVKKLQVCFEILNLSYHCMIICYV